MTHLWCFSGSDCLGYAPGAACHVVDIKYYPEFEDQNREESNLYDSLS